MTEAKTCDTIVVDTKACFLFEMKEDIMKKEKKKTRKLKKQNKLFGFFKEVINEMKKVRFATKKEMVTYSVATISFVLIFAAFFVITDLIVAGLKMLVA